MAKPIFLIQLPGQMATAQTGQIARKIQEKLEDWHVLLIPATVQHVTYTAFSADTAEEVDIEDLKRKVEEALNEIATRS